MISSEGIEHNLSGRTEAALYRKAIKQRWPLPEKYKQAVIERQVKIAVSPESTPRESTSAAKVIMTAEAQNQADELKLEPAEVGQHVHFHQHGEGVNGELGTGEHNAKRLERLRTAIAERERASGIGNAG